MAPKGRKPVVKRDALLLRSRTENDCSIERKRDVMKRSGLPFANMTTKFIPSQKDKITFSANRASAFTKESKFVNRKHPSTAMKPGGKRIRMIRQKKSLLNYEKIQKRADTAFTKYQTFAARTQSKTMQWHQIVLAMYQRWQFLQDKAEASWREYTLQRD